MTIAPSLTPAAGQILRQHSKHLMRDDCFLRLLESGRHYGLFNKRAEKRAIAKIDVAHIENWRCADLLNDKKKVKDGAVLSATGKAWLRRASATHSPFMAQHQQRGKSKHEEAARADCNVSQTPLEWLRAHSRKSSAKKSAKKSVLISDVEFDAGERLRCDFERAQLSQKMGMDWSRPVFVDGGGNAGDISDHALDCRKRVRAALTYAGPGLADMLISVCCCLQGLEESEAAYHLPRRSGKVMLKLALIRLSVFYGLQSEDNAAASFRTR